jgi:predicted transcriptional regulator
MTFWIAEACKQAREDTDHRLSEIAGAIGVDQTTIYRFETHRTQNPGKLNAIVGAYEQVTGVGVAELLERAAELAREGDG